VVACQSASSSAVTGLAALLGSVAAPAEDTLAKLLDPKKVVASPPRWLTVQLTLVGYRLPAWKSSARPLTSG
jgi:hypothetical protein